MKSKIDIFTLLVILCEYGVSTLSFPGPPVYVVTPSGRHLKKDEGRPAPFYYHNWMRRSDTGPNTNTTATTTTESAAPKVKTPDLIFAEFESDGSLQKSIRKLLEKERTGPRKTTMSSIYVPDEEQNKITRVVTYGLPVKTSNIIESTTENVKYPFMPHEGYYNNMQSPVYVTSPRTVLPVTTTKITTTTSSPNNIQNIWHVIDNEKSNQYSNKWEEIALESKTEKNANNEETDYEQKNYDDKNYQIEGDENNDNTGHNDDISAIDENFALPGFATNPGNGGENESRAIRTEQHMRFPYVNLKPFQIKSSKKPINNLSNVKKNNLFTNLDNFYDLKNPVRGEAQDIVPLTHIDRYNPAQPYLPQQKYVSSLSKQSDQALAPPKTTASLVPPPPPPLKLGGNDFPLPTSYESFPPYAPSAPDFDSAPAPAPPPSQPASVSITPSVSQDVTSGVETSGLSVDDSEPTLNKGYRYKPPFTISDSDSIVSMMNTGYQYEPPSVPKPQFYPTPVPPSVPFQGYAYKKPSMTVDDLPMPVTEKPVFQGYHYNKPTPSKPPIDNIPPSYGSPPSYETDDFPPDVYEHNDSPPPHLYDHDDSPHQDHHSDDSDLVYGKKPYGDVKGGDDMKDDVMDMMPPSPPSLHTDVKPGAYGPPSDDHGFPSDFPSDFHSDVDDHDHDHYHYHIIPPTTTTTEMPRVNRFSYYYLGKKLYYLPLYFSVYFIIYVAALIIKAVLRHKIVYPNSWRPNTTTATFFSKRSLDEYLSHENMHELTKKVTHAIGTAAEKYMSSRNKMS